MPLDRPNTLATFLFTGLALVEFNKTKQCEIKIVRCPEHDFTVDIFEIALNPLTHEDNSSAPIFHSLSLRDDIDIYLELSGRRPIENDATPYLVAKPRFVRAKDKGDDHDFRWVLDIQKEVHKEPLKERKNGGPFGLRPKLTFSNGLFYTEKKEQLRFALAPIPPARDDFNMLGKIAFIVAADITCPPKKGNRVVLKDKANRIQKLPWKPNIRYEIKINNTCTLPNDDQTGTDFTIYSKVLEPVSGKKKRFDLRQVIEHSGNPYGKRLADHRDFVVDSGQQACNLVTKPTGT